jgi:DNA-binding transcriptional ArsR family regulator
MENTISCSLDHIFAALADPVRRAILARLRQGQVSVGELAQPFELTLPAISKHLNVLERAGLIRRIKDAQRRQCQLNPAGLVLAVDWLEEYRVFWENQLDALEAFLAEDSPAVPTRGKENHEC